MNWNFSQMSERFANPTKSKLLLDGLWGMEKEAQRVDGSGELAATNHPLVFGEKLTHPHITVDFAESQMELITSAFGTIEEAYDELIHLQEWADQQIKHELLWPLSMPPRLPDESLIPIAKFADTPEGREGEIYRSGIAARYGMKKQMISGIHYNFSLGPRLLADLFRSYGNGRSVRIFNDDVYVSLARNVLRYRWLIIYLFGASPAMDRSYHSVILQELNCLSPCCLEACNPMTSYEKYAISLRVSRFGYVNANQVKDGQFLHSLNRYTQTLRKLLATRSNKFSQLITEQPSRSIQLNDHILQKESEFYSPIRLKQNINKGETHLDALEKRGVQYAEVRLFDLNPFHKAGLSLEQLYFLQVFMMYCLFEESKNISEDEWTDMNRNHHRVSLLGRKPGLKLIKNNKEAVRLKDWSNEIFEKLHSIAVIMDLSGQGHTYQDCVIGEYTKVNNPSLLPSALIAKEMKWYKENHIDFGIRHALAHKNKGTAPLNAQEESICL